MKGAKPEDGYKAGPPWTFRGRALYQLHLVRTEVARRLIPEELHVVDFFGYTLGGIYFAEYDQSPAGKFNELVALAGIVWNPPTSCAWATRVLVDSHVARDHGRQEVGLPSRLASFSKSGVCAMRDRPRRGARHHLWLPGVASRQLSSPHVEGEDADMAVGESVRERTLVEIDDVDGVHPRGLCQLWLPPLQRAGAWAGPQIRIALPSFSGRTSLRPELLKYTCSLHCRVRVVEAARVDVEGHNKGEERGHASDVATVLGSKPLLALYFEDMEMRVQQPLAVPIAKIGNIIPPLPATQAKDQGSVPVPSG